MPTAIVGWLLAHFARLKAPMPKSKLLPIILLSVSTFSFGSPATDPWHAKAWTVSEHSINIPTVEGRDWRLDR